jgi:hypothetical protein
MFRISSIPRNDPYTIIFPDSSKVTDEDLTKLFSKIAATIDKICQEGVSSEVRLTKLRDDLNTEREKDPEWRGRITSAAEWIKKSSAAATTIVGAIDGIVKLLKSVGM